MNFCSECGTERKGNSNFCANCGVTFIETSTKVDHVNVDGHVSCPVCKKSDMVNRTATIVDSGSSRGIAVGYIPHHGFAPAVSASATNLASRLSGVPLPGRPTISMGFGLGLGAWFLAIKWMWDNASGEPDIAYGVLAAAISSPALLVGGLFGVLLAFVVGAPKHETQRAIAINARIRDGYYCSRDDFAFIPGGISGRPEEFVRKVIEEQPKEWRWW